MRIVFVIASLNSGGAERVIANLANCFAAQKDEIELILFNDVRYYELDERVKVHIIKEEKRRTLTLRRKGQESISFKYGFDQYVSHDV